MEVKTVFPTHRLHDPTRQAELAVYRALEGSSATGVAVYEPRCGRYQTGLDFVVLIEGVGRYGLEVKGGQYSVKGGSWRLARPTGQQEIECPALQAWDGAMAYRDRVALVRGKGPFVVAVLVFPDMAPDDSIRQALADTSVHATFGVEGLTGQLAQLATVAQPPCAADVEREAALVQGSDLPAEGAGALAMDLQAGQIIIQHVEHLHLAGAETAFPAFFQPRA